MAKFKCAICGYIHDEEENGDFNTLDGSWVCPICGADKSVFEKEEEKKIEKVVEEVVSDDLSDDYELSLYEMSVLCTNLAKGFEKLYKEEEFNGLLNVASELSNLSKKSTNNNDQIISLIEEDLNKNFINANVVCDEYSDRGAKRALVWSEKVTRMLSSIIKKYNEVGEEYLVGKDVYVCTICGFIYIGNELPEVCPVCKVPNYKFEKIAKEDL